MKSKGAIKLFAIALTVVCVFQLSFTWFTYRAESAAKEFANGDVEKERAQIPPPPLRREESKHALAAAP